MSVASCSPPIREHRLQDAADAAALQHRMEGAPMLAVRESGAPPCVLHSALEIWCCSAPRRTCRRCASRRIAIAAPGPWRMTAPTPGRPSTSPCSSRSAGYPRPDHAHQVVSERRERYLEPLIRSSRPWLLACAADMPHPPACLRSIGDVRDEQGPPVIASRRRRVVSMCGRGGVGGRIRACRVGLGRSMAVCRPPRCA